MSVFFSPVHSQVAFIGDVANRSRRQIAYLSLC